MVLRVALGGESVSLDGVGEYDRRAVVFYRGESVPECGEIVAAEVADGGAQGGGVQVGDQRGDGGVAAG